MKILNNQKGFTVVGTVIVVAVIALLGVCGWFVYDRQKGKNISDSPAQSSINSFDECKAAGNPVMESNPEQCSANGKSFINNKQKVTTDETTDWLLYTPPGNEYSVKLADGWELTRYEKTTGLSTFDNTDTVQKQGTKAVVTEVSGGRDGRTGFFFNYATQNIEQIVTPGKKQTSLKTNDGLEVEKYYWIVTGYSDEGGLGVGNGDSEYTYVIRKASNKVVTLSYSFQPGQTDNSSTVEKVLKTIHFN